MDYLSKACLRAFNFLCRAIGASLEKLKGIPPSKSPLILLLSYIDCGRKPSLVYTHILGRKHLVCFVVVSQYESSNSSQCQLLKLCSEMIDKYLFFIVELPTIVCRHYPHSIHGIAKLVSQHGFLLSKTISWCFHCLTF